MNVKQKLFCLVVSMTAVSGYAASHTDPVAASGFTSAHADPLTAESPDHEELKASKYSWCVDTSVVSAAKVRQIYQMAGSFVLQSPDEFMNGEHQYYVASGSNSSRLLLVLSDHSWIQGSFDVDEPARSIMRSADSLTVEHDGFIPKEFTKLDWSKADSPADHDRLGDHLSSFSDQQWDDVRKVFSDVAGIGWWTLRSMSPGQFVSAAQQLAFPHCDNRVANTSIAVYGGSDSRLAIQFIADGKPMSAAEDFIKQASDVQAAASAALNIEAAKRFMDMYPDRRENLAAEILGIVNRRPDITTAILAGAGHSPETFRAIYRLLIHQASTPGRDDALYAAVKAQASKPGTHVIAYGALHFMGKNGIIERLRADGFTVNPLPQ